MMANYRNGHEIRHGVPSPEAAMSPHKASGGPTDPIPNTTGKGSNASKPGVQAAPERAHTGIPGKLAPQVTQPNA